MTTDDERDRDGDSAHSVAVALENRLMSNGIYLTTFGWVDDDGGTDDSARVDPEDGVGARIEYETVAEVDAVTSNEVGAVVRTVLAIADEREWTPGRIEVVSLTTEGERRGRWHVEAEWFDRLHDDLSELEFSQRVLETIISQHVD